MVAEQHNFRPLEWRGGKVCRRWGCARGGHDRGLLRTWKGDPGSARAEPRISCRLHPVGPSRAQPCRLWVTRPLSPAPSAAANMASTAPSASAQTLQAAQMASLLSMLNLEPQSAPAVSTTPTPSRPSTPATPAGGAAAVWKVLVLDEISKDVLATVLRVQDLRDTGVTLHV